MANCPNCGRSTLRTKDWCCQWCGYPLFSGSFKSIDKTYKELKAERLNLESVQEEITEPEETVLEEPEEEIVEDTTDDEEESVVEEFVDEEPEPEPEPVAEEVEEVEEIIEEIVEEPSPRVVRRVRKVSRPPERPKKRRIIRRRRPVQRQEPEIEEVIEYIDEEPEPVETEVIYEDIEEDESDDEYEDVYEDEIEDEEDVEYIDEDEEEIEYVDEEDIEEPVVVATPPVKQAERSKPVVEAEPEEEVPDDEDTEQDEFVEDDDIEEYNEDIDEESEDELTEDEPEEETIIVHEAPEDAQPDLEITVDEIVSAYETDGTDADNRFVNKVLRITGTIQKVEVKESMSVFALILEASETHPLRQTVRCVFNREHSSDLRELRRTQTVTVQGKYDGSIINISMRDCFVVDSE